MSWECPCGITNRDSEIRCLGCGLTLEETKNRLEGKYIKIETEFGEDQETSRGVSLAVLFFMVFLLINLGLFILYAFYLERVIDKRILENIRGYYKLIIFIIGLILFLFILWMDERVINKQYHCPFCNKNIVSVKPKQINKCSYCSVELPTNWWKKKLG